MGILDLFTAGKKAEEITRAFIGAYVFSRMNDDQRMAIISNVYRMFCEGWPFPLSFDEAEQKFNTYPSTVQAAFMVNAMIYMGINHNVSGFQWDYISNPFNLSECSDKALGKACSNSRKYGIDPKECFTGNKDIV